MITYMILFNILLKGSSEEKLPKLTAGPHHVNVQFIPTELSPPSPDFQLKIIEKSENFMIRTIGIDYVLVLFMHVIEIQQWDLLLSEKI